MISLTDVIDADLDALLGFRKLRFETDYVEDYCEVLTLYLGGDVTGLRSAVARMASCQSRSDQHRAVWLLGEARLQIRSTEIVPEHWKILLELSHTHSEWQGEIHMLLSHYYNLLDQHENSKKSALLAFQFLKKQGAKRKAVRALMNALASESCAHPEKHYLPELYHVYREAKKAGDRTSIGTTLLNLSREYQKLGAQTTALKYAHRAVSVLSKNAGNLAHHLALLHRCHIFCELGAFLEAQMDAEVASISTFVEVTNGLKILKKKFRQLGKRGRQQTGGNRPAGNKSSGNKSVGSSLNSKEAAYVTPTWRERGAQKKAQPLSKLEQKALEMLASGPKSSAALVAGLYGDRIAESSGKARLDNLLYRLRKRQKSLILFSGGLYQLKSARLKSNK
jgi:hypothetical protein